MMKIKINLDVEVQYIGNTELKKRERNCGKIEVATINHHRGVLNE